MALDNQHVDWDDGSGLKVVFEAGDEIERICPECGVREAMEAVDLTEFTDSVLATIRSHSA